MIKSLLAQTGAVDLAAIIWFAVCWIGYALLADRSHLSQRGLVGLSHEYRLEWARPMIGRDARVTDAALVGNLMRSVASYP